jgi:hypothetical protein
MPPKKQRHEPWKLEKAHDLLCNLCLLEKPLSEDHIPPRCLGNDKPVKIRRFYHDARTGQYPFATRTARGGITFKTLCRDCNSHIGEWDPALKSLSAGVKAARRRGDLRLQGDLRAGAIVRAILGHSIAMKLAVDESTADIAVRDYLIHRKPLDPKMRVYVWHYPCDDVSVARDFVVTDFRVKKNTGILSVMKYRPVAMCAAFGGPPLTFSDFTQYAALDPCASVPIDMSFREPASPLWPEHALHVGPLQAVMVGAAYMECGVKTRGIEIASSAS